jgi:hypothetical protein
VPGTIAMVTAGVCLLALGLWDTALTVLHPARRGPMSAAIGRVTWRVLRAVSRRPGGRLLTFAGPLAMAAGFMSWVTSLWVGFALIYLPFIAEFIYITPATFGPPGLPEALYVSGVALTTVGFGDVVAATDTMRLVTVAQSASGLAAITAAIAYVLSVYPLVTKQRSAALRVSDLGLTDPGQVVRVLVQAGPSVLIGLQRALIEAHQDVTRFPVLYDFHPDRPEESTGRLLEAGIMVCLVLRWGVRPDAPGLPVVLGPALETTVRRVADDYDANYLAGREARAWQPGPAATAERLRRLRTAVAGAAPGLEATGAEVPADFAAMLAWADARLDRLARAHRTVERPLLTGEPGGADGPGGNGTIGPSHTTAA